jgi:hypothetical protein
MIVSFDLRAALATARNSVAALSRDQAGDASVTVLDSLLAGIDGGGELLATAETETLEIEPAEVEQAEPEAEPDVMLGQAHEAPPVVENAVENPREPGPVRGEPVEHRVWTPERGAKLLEMRANSEKWPAILETLNAMPGLPIASEKALEVHWHKLRRAGFVAPASPLASVPAEDMAEARQMMTASSSVGAKALADYFGWALETAQQVAMLIRAEQEGPAK